jgi:hypothetical protein
MRVLSTQYESLEALQADVISYAAEVEAHKLTIDIPAPFPSSEIVGIIVRGGHTIEWVEVEPSEDAASSEWTTICSKLKEENEKFIELLPYQQARSLAYPPIGDQLDSLFHAGVFPEEMAATIQAVKNTYPKPE